MPSIVLVAGDPSGDAHAARLVEALRQLDPTLTFAALGGPALRQAGVTLLEDLTAAAAIGPFDAARHAGCFVRAQRVLDAHLKAHRPELVILVDFGDFNLPVIAPLVKRHGIPVVYYISPQLWAWGRFRLRFVQRYVDHMIVFFSFEEAFYRQAGVPVTWVGHPLLEHAQPTQTKEAAAQHLGLNPWRRTVGLLPGSRVRELERHLPLMLKMAHHIAWRMPGVQFVLPKAPGLPREAVDRYLAAAGVDVVVAEGPLADTLQCLEAAVVASGTATLEAALAGVPMAVIYRTSWPTYLAAKLVVRIPDIALVNVVAGRRIVPEFVQHAATPQRVGNAIVELLRDEARAAEMRAGLAQVRERLGTPGAAERAANVMLTLLRPSR